MYKIKKWELQELREERLKNSTITKTEDEVVKEGKAEDLYKRIETIAGTVRNRNIEIVWESNEKGRKLIVQRNNRIYSKFKGNHYLKIP